jgi:hypothetical protein
VARVTRRRGWSWKCLRTSSEKVPPSSFNHKSFEHGLFVGVHQNMRIGVDPAKIIARKAGGSRYVGYVDQPGDGPSPAAARLMTLPP